MKIQTFALLFFVSFNSIAKAETAPVFQGLKKLNLERVRIWSQLLLTGESSNNFDSHDVARLVLKRVEESQSFESLVESILQLRLNRRYESADGYEAIVEGLLQARIAVRSRLDPRSTYAKEAIALLSILIDETLYIESILFREKEIVRFDYRAINTDYCNGHIAELNRIPLCQGDIMLSKGGAASSSFIAKIGDYPGNFSHSTTPLINARTKKIELIEAEIEDGVKLRFPQKDYINDRKAKLYIFRNKRGNVVADAVLGVEYLKEEIQKRVKGKDPTKVASFDYDFAMDADESEKLFCSEVPYLAYDMGNTSSKYNPYPQHLWSRVTTKAKATFLDKFLEIGTHFPAPSDVELNSDYALVAAQYNLHKISNDRMMIALIDTLFTILENEETILNSALDRLGSLGSGSADPKVILKKLELLEASGVKIPAGMKEKVKFIPKNISYKQLIFFTFLNEVLGTKVKAKLSALEKNLLTQKRHLDLITMRVAIDTTIREEIKRFSEQVGRVLK